jgi:hypothetical protein
MRQQRVQLSLHIRHPTRDLSKVCSGLGLKPKHIWKKGDERRTPKGNKIGGLRDASYCSIDLSPVSRKSLVEQIEANVEMLKRHRSTLRKLSSTGGVISFYIGWFCDEHTGEALSTQLLGAMSDLRIALELNIYIPDS